MARPPSANSILRNSKNKIIPTGNMHGTGNFVLPNDSQVRKANKELIGTIPHTSTTSQTADDHHAQSHNITSHSDTTATGTELNSLTDNSMVDTLHRHSELSASDGTPDKVLEVDATGQIDLTIPAGAGDNFKILSATNDPVAIFYNAGIVGINTTLPNATLGVDGNFRSFGANSGFILNSRTGTNGNFQYYNATGISLNIYNDDLPGDVWRVGGSGDVVNIGKITVLGTNTSKFSGNVGIHLASAEAYRDLHVAKVLGDSAALIHSINNTTNNHASLQFSTAFIDTDTKTKAGIYFQNDNSGNNRGDLKFCMDDANDTANVAIGDVKMTLTHEGELGIGVAPTLPLDVKAKSGMSDIGGICIKLTNKTGAASVAGQLVQADTANNDAVILAPAGNVDTIGVFLDAGVADGSEAWVVVSGIADVALDDNVAAVRGYWMGSGVLAGYAATSVSPPAAPTHFEEIGHCIESVAAGGAGTHILARCVLHFN